MNYLIKSEENRLPAAIQFASARMEELKREIKSCDYYEDPHGELVYAPGSYAEEKRHMKRELDHWQTMLNILASKPPVCVVDL